MTTGLTISKEDMNEAFKSMAQDAIALAVVTSDGTVAFHYAKQGCVNTDPQAASTIINTVAKLVAEHQKD